MGRRVFITGSMGFTAQYLTTEMEAAGFEVWGSGQHRLSDKERYVCVDLLDLDGLTKIMQSVNPDLVIHLAAMAFVGHSSPNDFYAVNVVGTRNILEAITASRINVEHVVLASSANIYGNAQGGKLNELSLCSPENDYAISKLAAEKVAYLWRRHFPITVTRPFNYTGVGQAGHFLVPKIVRHFLDRAPLIELGNLDVYRDFSDVRDVAKLYRLISENPENFRVLNICSGKTISLRSILDTARQITRHEIEVTVNPEFVRRDEVKVLSGDPALLESVVGKHSRIEFEHTLAWMLAESS